MSLFTRDAKVEALKKASLFDGLSRKQLVELARVAEDVDFGAGKVLCRQGDRGQEFFVIMEGEAEITQNGKRIATCKAGDFFGEIALIEQVPRTATVTSTSPIRFFVITSQAFFRLLDEQPGIERKVLRSLARRLVPLDEDPTI